MVILGGKIGYIDKNREISLSVSACGMVQYQVKNKNRMCAVLREGIGLVSDIIIVGAGVVGCALAVC